MTRIAALPMYDLPELTAANDALWAAIAERLEAAGLPDVPKRLTRDAPLEAVWTDPGLLLAQTCGYPLMTTLRGRVSVVATPRYLAEGCDGPLYRSAVIVRADSPAAGLADLRGDRCAINAWDSNSGMNGLRAAIAPLAQGEAFFSEIVTTGAHVRSAEAVANGAADVAAIDCVTLAHLQRLRPALTQRLRILTWTPQTPGLPLITSLDTDAAHAALARALDDVAHDPALEATRAALLLDGFDTLTVDRYEAVLDLERIAIGLDYPSLR